MNMDGALTIAAKAQAELEPLLLHMKKSGVVDILIAGATGSTVLMEAYPTLGVHLSVGRDKVAAYAEEIMHLAGDIVASGVRVTIFPRPDGRV